ncbi:MAG: hypothetical protein H6539_01305 [Bacteroidales bacterium]|nr:hypothetical protein [Bacteroidales bacterium]
MNKFIYFLTLLILPLGVKAATIVTVGATGADFATFEEAFFAINNVGSDLGDVEIQVIDNTTETSTAILLASGWDGLSTYSSVTVYPVSSGLTVSGNLNAALFEINGAATLTFDGRVNRTGVADLVISNTNTGTSASTFKFLESANTNTIEYCIIKGSNRGRSSGVIHFSTSGSGGGNSSNLIDHNYITNAGNRPLNLIYSSGTSGFVNSGNIISNNNFYDFVNPDSISNAVLVSDFSTDFTISGNSFYETSSFAASANVNYYIIRIDNVSGVNFTVSGNFIGGSSPSCGGSPWTKTNSFDNAFYGIYINAGTGTSSSIQNNTIRNIDWANAGNASWYGMNIVGGDINIGTGTGNTIGATTGNGSVLITSSGNNNNIFCINSISTGIVDCRNNTIGSITCAKTSATQGSVFYAINRAGASGTITITNNLIGSTSSSNSIYLSSASTNYNQYLLGINNSGNGTVVISGNTIANLTNASARTSTLTADRIQGIVSTNGTNTISGNVIHDLTIGCANASTGATVSVCGISTSGNTSAKNITGNTIYNLSNSNTSFTGGIIGIIFQANISANTLSNNFVYNLSVTGVSSLTASLIGIKKAQGSVTMANNIISLGGTTKTNVYGIFGSSAVNENSNIYFNTVYIYGNVSSGSNTSYGIYISSSLNDRNLRNNVIYNARSTTPGPTLHYAIYFASPGGTLTLDYNDYFVSGSSSALGFYNSSDVTSLPIVAGQDANSINLNPVFTVPGSTTASDYTIGIDPIGVTGTGITTDYALATRNNPTPGAWERVVNKWKGTSNTDWNTASNWTGSAIPLGVDRNIYFDDAPLNNLNLDQDRSVTDITNTSAFRMVTNGHKLTIKGNLVFSGGAQIDASSASSTVEFAGTSAQSIPAGAFLNDQIYNLTVNNSNNLSFNGTLNLLNSLTTTSGLLDATTNSPTFSFSGSTPQTIVLGRFLNDRIYNLSANNASGVTLNDDFTVDNNLNVNSGIFTVSAGKRLTVTGTATVTGTMNLKSDATGTASLIASGGASGAGTTNVERYITGNTWHNLAPSVSGHSIQTFLTTPANNIPTKTLTVLTYGMEYYDEGTGVWTYYDANNIGSAGNFIPGRGYLTRNTSDGVVTFSGILNAGNTNVSITKTRNGWNSLGNPYTSSIGLNDGSTTTNFMSANLANLDASYNGAYFWNGTTYTIINNVDGATYIQPGQGFLVKSKAGGATINFTSAMQAHSNPVFYKKSSSAPWEEIRLFVTNSSDSAYTRILFRDDMTRGLDISYDGGLFSGSSKLHLYTKLVEDNGVNFMVQCLPSQETDSMIVPVGLDYEAGGLLTFNANINSLPAWYTAVLEDRLAGVFTDLSQPGANYQVAVEPGTTGTGRFFLHTVAAWPNNIKITDKKEIRIFAFQREIFVEGWVDANTTAGLYDLTGKKLQEFKLQTRDENRLLLNEGIMEGIYLLKVNGTGIQKTEKVFIK